MTAADKTIVGGNLSKYVKLNVGGCLYFTTIATLCKQDTMLRAMFSGQLEPSKDAEGWILIDRCGTHFGKILNFLRDGTVALPETTEDILELLVEAKYYCVEALCDECQEVLAGKGDTPEPICRMPLVTSQCESEYLIRTSGKPVIQLSISRRNEVVSLFSDKSNDTFLKNIELFDKFSLRLNGRVLFIKDVVCPNAICKWSFYGNGKMVSQVQCMPHHSNVLFPETLILEEILNVLKFEKKSSQVQRPANFRVLPIGVIAILCYIGICFVTNEI